MAGPLPEIIAGRYRPVGEIGKGGMGSVLLVEHVNTGDKLALKMLHKAFGHRPDLVERFKREARAAAKIKSDHVVRITDADVAEELGGLPFMVMEVLNGEDVRKRLQRLRTLPKDYVIHILSQVARALDRAHAIGIIHRDIKPENIFLHVKEDGTEIVKVLDFGISKILDEQTEENATQTGQLLGTPSFMAPEQVRTGPVSPQTDMWAIGMVAHRLLVGKPYWPRVSPGELMAAVLMGPMNPPTTQLEAAHLGAAYDAWFMKSCDRDPTKRWASVTEQVNALAEALRIAAPASARPSFAQLPATSTEARIPHDVERTAAEPSVTLHTLQNSAVTNRTHSTQNASTKPFAMIGALAGLFIFVAWGSLNVMRAFDSGPKHPGAAAFGHALPSASPSIDATPTPSAALIATTPAVTAASAASPNTENSSAIPIASASASASSSAAARDASHDHPPASTKKPTPASSAKTEDPWAR